MTNSIAELEETDCIFVIGSNPTEAHPIIGARMLSAKQKGAKLIVVDPRKTHIAEHADLHLRPYLGGDIALLNGMMRLIIEEGWHNPEFIQERTEGFEALKEKVSEYPLERVKELCGIRPEDIRTAAELYARAGKSTICYTLGITEHTCGTNGVLSLANLAMLTGHVGRGGTGVNPLRGQNNVQGACDMGALPNVFSGYQAVTSDSSREKFEKAWGAVVPPEPGLTELEMFDAADEGRVKGMYIFGENPLLADPNVNHVRKALGNLDFLVVQDIFLTEVGEVADVVLPGASFAETEGTFTNTERRVQRVRKAIEPVGDAKPNWTIFSLLAEELGSTAFRYDSPEAIFREIASLTPSYAGMSHQRLDSAESLQWPCPSQDHPGTPFLHQERFAKGVGTFTPIDHTPPAELPDEAYPLQLITGRDIFHYNTGSMTRQCPKLMNELWQNYVEINPVDAEELGIGDGEPVRASSPRGSIRVRAKLSERVYAGTVFMAFHFPDSVTNVLTNDAADPITKTPEYKACSLRIEKMPQEAEAGERAEDTVRTDAAPSL
jgi:formate dehydrogenase alpha subunit